LLIDVLASVRIEIVYLLEEFFHMLAVNLASVNQLIFLLEEFVDVAVYQLSIV
jgi:hypothetical protein